MLKHAKSLVSIQLMKLSILKSKRRTVLLDFDGTVSLNPNQHLEPEFKKDITKFICFLTSNFNVYWFSVSSELYIRESLREHGLKSAVCSKVRYLNWDTVSKVSYLRLLGKGLLCRAKPVWIDDEIRDIHMKSLKSFILIKADSTSDDLRNIISTLEELII